MHVTVPRNLESLDYAALDKIEAQIKTRKAQLFLEAEAKGRSLLEKIGQAVGGRFEPVVLQPASNGNGQHKAVKAKGRKATKIAIKYRNPAKPEETWSGRGRMARWLAAEVKKGRQAQEFAVTR